MTAVQRQEEHTDRLLKSATDREITEEESNAWIKDCNVSISGFTVSNKVYDYGIMLFDWP